MPATAAEQRSRTVTGSPVGPLTLVASRGALTGLFMSREPAEAADAAAAAGGCAELLGEASRQLAEYFDGTRTEFDIPLLMEGTSFQQRVWQALREIPYGETMSYGQVAGRIGQPTASRAVGLANGRNPVSIIVPCHRVIGADGSLTGYGGGIERKQYLLAHEQRISGRTLA